MDYLQYKVIKGKEYYCVGYGGYIKVINVDKINQEYLVTIPNYPISIIICSLPNSALDSCSSNKFHVFCLILLVYLSRLLCIVSLIGILLCA